MELNNKQIEILNKLTIQYNENTELLSCQEILEDETKILHLTNQNKKISKIVVLYKNYCDLIKEYRDLNNLDYESELIELVKNRINEITSQLNNIYVLLSEMLLKFENEYQNIIIQLSGYLNEKLFDVIKTFVINMCIKYGYVYSVIEKKYNLEFYISGYGALDKLSCISGINKDNSGNIVTALVYNNIKRKYFNESDKINISAFRSSGAGGQNINKLSTAIRVTHLDTNISVVNQDERTQLQNKNKAIENLKIKVNNYYKQLYLKEIEKQKVNQLKNVSRGTINNIFNFENNKISGIINMKISEFIQGNI